MYKRIQGANSPLSPLPQPSFKSNTNTPSTRFFSPSRVVNKTARINDSIKRSFTPNLNEVTPPSISPIDKLNETLVIRKSPDFNRTVSLGDIKMTPESKEQRDKENISIAKTAEELDSSGIFTPKLSSNDKLDEDVDLNRTVSLVDMQLTPDFNRTIILDDIKMTPKPKTQREKENTPMIKITEDLDSSGSSIYLTPPSEMSQQILADNMSAPRKSPQPRIPYDEGKPEMRRALLQSKIRGNYLSPNNGYSSARLSGYSPSSDSSSTGSPAHEVKRFVKVKHVSPNVMKIDSPGATKPHPSDNNAMDMTITIACSPSSDSSSTGSPHEVKRFAKVKHVSPNVMKIDSPGAKKPLSLNDLLNITMDMKSILMDIHMEKYIELFNKEEIDLFVFCLMNANDLEELNIHEEDRSAMLEAIKLYADIFDAHA